jgi:class 3 adenylate cyclase
MLNHNQSMNDYLYWIVLGVRRFNACGAALIQIGACILLPYAGQYVSLVYGEVAAYEGGTDYQWILANQLSNSKKQAKEFQQLSSAFFSGSDERPGVKGLLPELDDLHLRESCDVGSVTGDLRHDLYSCFGIQGLISTMDSFVREIAINSENDPSVNTLFSSSLHINLAHLVLAEMSDHLTRANDMVVDALHSRTNMTRAVIIILLVCIALVFLFHLWLLHRTVKRLKRLCKTGMVMIRRVSPSAIINSEEITLLILGHKATEKEIESSPAFVTFECLPRATLVVSTDETIEDINMKARELLAFTRRQIIGQKIDTVIHRPSTVESADKSQGERSGEGSVGERSTGERNVGERSLVGDIAEGAVEAIRARQLFEAFARMRRAGCEHWKASTIVDCHRADDEVVSCVVDLQGIPDVTGQVDGFLLFMSDTSAESKMAAQVHEAKERVARLKNQLIPSDVQGFIHGDRTDFSFVTKTVCVVTVQVSTFTAHMKHIGTVPFLEQLRDFFGRVAVLCAQQPQLMKQSEFVDTFIAAGGLFSADDPAVYAHAAVTFAKNVLEFVERKVPKEGEAEFRVQIGIALGGPLLCALTGLEEKSFVAVGAIIEEALSLAEVAPPNKIIVSLAVKAAIQEEDFEPGPALIDGAPSFFLKFAQAPKPPPRKPGSTARSPTFNDAGPLPMDGEASAPVAPQEPSPPASQFELSGRIDANCSPSEPPS